MKDLSKDLEFAIDNCIESLDYPVDVDSVDSDKLAKLMQSKTDSFTYTKDLIVAWENSQNSPSHVKLKKYITDLVNAGESAIETLRQALRKKIDFSEVDAEKHGTAVKAKPIIFQAINSINSGILQLRLQLDADKFDLKNREFSRGYPERFANQEFFPLKNYHEKWYDEATDSIMLCPFGTKGEIVTLDGLNIMMPKVPAKTKILYHKLPPSEQYWRRTELPKGLTPDNEDIYAEYILEEFRRRREGLWFFNNGSPVYITGGHYMALQWVQMIDDGVYMQFRYAQRDMFYFTKACTLDPRCVGEIFLKSRRTGFTFQIIAEFVNDSTAYKNKKFGITSKTGDDAEEVFLKYTYSLQNLPFFFLPVIKGKIDSVSEIYFANPSDSSKITKKKRDTNTDDYLNTLVDHAKTLTLAYDSKKLFRYLGDEAGKWLKPQNYVDHWSNVKPTMVTGGRVVGKAFIGSTMAPLDKGGSQFKTLYYGSDATKRNANNRTPTGLYSYFLPAHFNQEDYTDIYGVCHQVLTEGQSFFNAQGEKKTIGSLQFLENEFKSAKAMGGKSYNNARRLDPITVDDAFRPEVQSDLFDIEKIAAQMKFNRDMNIEHTLVRGNFRWKDGIKDTVVEWHPEEKGRFLLSWLPPPEMRNKWVKKNIFGDLCKCPEFDYGCGGADSYDQTAVIDAKLITTESGTEWSLGSKGAVHFVTGTTFGDIPSNNFILEYIARPKDADTFFEDVLMAVVFYSIPILIENNKKMLLKHFKVRGYRGYSITRFDKLLNRLSPDEKELGGTPSSGDDQKVRHWSILESYINRYVGVYEQGEDAVPIREEGVCGSMPFQRTLEDWSKFDPDNRTAFDASMSSGLALMGLNRNMYKPKEEKKVVQMSFQTYSLS